MKDNNSSGGESQPKTGVVYKITCLLNGKPYVGQTRRKLSERIKGHRNSKIKSGVDGAIKKYGWENFSVEVCPVEMLNEREIFWIAKLNSKAPNGYNLTDGGESPTLSKETREKISAACKGRPAHNKGKHHSEELRAKMSAAHKGKPSHNKGKKASPETCAKISANHADVSGEKNGFYGKHHSEESRTRMSLAKKGKPRKPHSQETREKISASNKGKHSHGKGKHLSEEHKAKISVARKAWWAWKKLENGGNK